MDRGLGLGFGVAWMRWVDDGGGRVDGAGVAVCVVEHGGAQVGHSACGPPCVAQPVEQYDALFELVGCAIDVHFQPARAEVAVHDAEGDGEGVRYDGEWWEELRGLGI